MRFPPDLFLPFDDDPPSRELLRCFFFRRLFFGHPPSSEASGPSDPNFSFCEDSKSCWREVSFLRIPFFASFFEDPFFPGFFPVAWPPPSPQINPLFVFRVLFHFFHAPPLPFSFSVFCFVIFFPPLDRLSQPPEGSLSFWRSALAVTPGYFSHQDPSPPPSFLILAAFGDPPQGVGKV